MTIHKIAGIDGPGYASYLAARESASRRGDYYLGADGDPVDGVGTWHGHGAAELGLHGEVTRGDLLRSWEGRDPRTGDILVRRSAQGDHVAAVDVTFSAPKSVSVLWALSDPEHRPHIEAAQTHAVTVALDHLERSAALVRRRIDGDITHEPAAGLVAARFRHHTARLSADQAARGLAPDPQLHDHVAIANLALRHDGAEASNGRWAAIDSRALYRLAAEAGAVYRAELAEGLQRLGHRMHREGRYFEVTGIPVALRDAFSARTHEVDAARRDFVARCGRSPRPEEMADLVVRSRQPKSAEHRPAFPQWHDRARATGIEPSALPLVPRCRPRSPTGGR